ncbi:MAG: hypothetical protein ACI87J_002058 [Colwellia sp.]|jgi:hypothetical protein
MYQFKSIKHFYNIVIIALLFGCQTPIENAGSEHKLVGEKWSALSGYAKSHLTSFDLTISARLAITPSIGNNQFKLTDFKLSKNTNVFNIDLLMPKFEHKYICMPECMQLIEYNKKSTSDGQTALSSYFEKYEFELFKFYGDLYILNKQIELINNKYNGTLVVYLNWLNDQNYSFTSLNDFFSFLTTSLTISEIDKFISEPSRLYSSKSMIQPSNSIEKDWISPSILTNDIPELSEEIILPDASWPVNHSIVVQNKISSFQSVKKLSVGKVVCSFTNNYFGIVLSFDKEEAKVLVKGQAKQINDGIIAELEAGALLNEKLDYFFTPLHEEILLSKSQLFSCEIEM